MTERQKRIVKYALTFLSLNLEEDDLCYLSEEYIGLDTTKEEIEKIREKVEKEVIMISEMFK